MQHDIDTGKPRSWRAAIPAGCPETSGNWWVIGDRLLYVRTSREVNHGWYWYGASDPSDLDAEEYLGFEYKPAVGHEERALKWLHPDLYAEYGIK
jgi:hypothetical protein